MFGYLLAKRRGDSVQLKQAVSTALAAGSPVRSVGVFPVFAVAAVLPTQWRPRMPIGVRPDSRPFASLVAKAFVRILAVVHCSIGNASNHLPTRQQACLGVFE